MIIAAAFFHPAGGAEPPLPGAERPVSIDRASVQQALAREEFPRVATQVKPLAEGGDVDSRFVLGVLMDLGLGVELDHPQALEWLRKAAEAGQSSACRYLAWRYETGFGLEQPDPAGAENWRRRAPDRVAEALFPRAWLEEDQRACIPNLRRALLWLLDRAGSGDSAAQASVALVYLSTDWTTLDTEQHVYWLKRAADGGNVSALQALASYHERGMLVVPDEKQAVRYARAAAEAGSADAQFLLGRWFHQGRFVGLDAGEAARWYRAAAGQDHTDAILQLIPLLRDGGPGLELDFKEAMQVAQRGAQLGLAEAITHIADLYNRGDGVPPDYAKSADYYRQAADKGSIRAMTMLGWIHLKGELGQVDYVEAQKWFERAAAEGSTRAQRELGLMYRDGLGVERDLEQAFEWIERAARAGDAWSQRELGGMLAQGVGCERDEEEAQEWFKLAAKNEAGGGAVAEATDPLETLYRLGEALRHEHSGETRDLFVAGVWRLSETQSAVFRPKFTAWLDEPHLITLPGLLPEGCLEVLEKVPALADRPAAQRLLRQMIEADRPQAQLVIARHALYGAGMPIDVELARRAARALRVRSPKDGERWLAIIDSICGETPALRTTARKTLRDLAEAGDGPSALLLAERLRTGIGDDYNPALGRRLLERAARTPQRVATVHQYFDKRQAAMPQPPAPDVIVRKTGEAIARRAKGQDALPAVVYQQPPTYPLELRAAGVEGEAQVAFIVNTAGVPVKVEATKSSHPLFAAAAERSISQWRFAPGWKEGRPVNTRMLQPLTFLLKDEKK